MNHNSSCSKMFRQLEALRTNRLDVFINFKLNINSVFQKLAIEKLEKFFYEQEGDAHTIYEIKPEAQSLFAWHLGVGCHNVITSFFVISPDEECAVLFQVDSASRIRDKAHVFGKDRIADLIQTFDGYFITVLKDGFDEYEEETNNTEIVLTEDDFE